MSSTIVEILTHFSTEKWCWYRFRKDPVIPGIPRESSYNLEVVASNNWKNKSSTYHVGTLKKMNKFKYLLNSNIR